MNASSVQNQHNPCNISRALGWSGMRLISRCTIPRMKLGFDDRPTERRMRERKGVWGVGRGAERK